MTQKVHIPDLGVPQQPLTCITNNILRTLKNSKRFKAVQVFSPAAICFWNFEIEIIFVVPLSHDLKTSWCLYWSLEAKYEHPLKQQSSHTGKKKAGGREEKKLQKKKIKCSTVAARKHMLSRQGGKQSGKHMHLIQR